jgi:hypothetical protein
MFRDRTCLTEKFGSFTYLADESVAYFDRMVIAVGFQADRMHSFNGPIHLVSGALLCAAVVSLAL